MNNTWKLINQLSYVDLDDEIDKLENIIIDKRVIISDIKEKVLKIEEAKDDLERSRDEIISFRESSFIKRLKYIKPSKKDLISLYIMALVSAFLGITIGMLFLPFGLIFIGVFYYGAHPYFKEAHEKWKTLKNKKTEPLEIKIVWKEVEIDKLNKIIKEIKDEITKLNSDLENLMKQIEEAKDMVANNCYETTSGLSMEDDSNYCKSYKDRRGNINAR
jgi:uncharacterized coiled-coil protein SlyX